MERSLLSTDLSRVWQINVYPSLMPFKAPFQWTNECQKSFEKLKVYLTKSPLLTSPLPRNALYLYFATIDETIFMVLIKEGSQQNPIYYARKVLQANGVFRSQYILTKNTDCINGPFKRISKTLTQSMPNGVFRSQIDSVH